MQHDVGYIIKTYVQSSGGETVFLVSTLETTRELGLLFSKTRHAEKYAVVQAYKHANVCGDIGLRINKNQKQGQQALLLSKCLVRLCYVL